MTGELTGLESGGVTYHNIEKCHLNIKCIYMKRELLHVIITSFCGHLRYRNIMKVVK